VAAGKSMISPANPHHQKAPRLAFPAFKNSLCKTAGLGYFGIPRPVLVAYLEAPLPNADSYDVGYQKTLLSRKNTCPQQSFNIKTS